MRISQPMILLTAAALLSVACRAPASSEPRVRTHTNPTTDAAAGQAPAGAQAASASSADESAPRVYLNLINGDAARIESELGALPGVIAGRVVLFTEPNLGKYPKHWRGGWVNGGTPVEADLEAHLSKAALDVERLIPDPEWDGYAVIDYEHWGVFWNGGASPEYQDRVRAYVRARYPSASDQAIEEIAAKEWDEKSRAFMLETIALCKRLRPDAQWGFFGYPKIGFGNITAEVAERIEKQRFIFDHVDVVYPEVYARRVTGDGPKGDLKVAPAGFLDRYIDDMILWSKRLSGDKPVMAYASLHHNSQFEDMRERPLSDGDMATMLHKPLEAGAAGVILWDAVGSAERAARFRDQFYNRVMPMFDIRSNQPADQPGEAGSSRSGAGGDAATTQSKPEKKSDETSPASTVTSKADAPVTPTATPAGAAPVAEAEAERPRVRTIRSRRAADYGERPAEKPKEGAGG